MNLDLKKNTGILIEKCSLAFTHHHIFSNFSLDVKAGSWVCLLGCSGVGKTSLLKMILELQPFQSGRITATDGQSLKSRMAYMAQQDLLMPWLSILDNVLLGYRLRGQRVKTHDLIQQATTLLKRVGLAHVASLKPQSLSAGMRQRVALVRTLIENKPIVLMDEPFSALDVVTRCKMHALAAELLADKTVLFITHDPLEAIRLADIIYIMQKEPVKLSKPIVPEGSRVRSISNQATLTLYSHLLTLLSASQNDA
jgi:putative hydroxymethylpyrimidine transport system ATP-binding protein